jgi:hypothetical protein
VVGLAFPSVETYDELWEHYLAKPYPLDIDATEFIPTEERAPELVLLALFPSGELRTVKCQINTSAGRTQITIANPLMLVDPRVEDGAPLVGAQVLMQAFEVMA